MDWIDAIAIPNGTNNGTTTTIAEKMSISNRRQQAQIQHQEKD